MVTLLDIDGILALVKRIIMGCVMLLSVVLVVIILPEYECKANTLDNAYDYYKAYGDNASFHSTSESDGFIYFVSRGNKATSELKYRTIGWQLQAKDRDGQILQNIYFVLGGQYLTHCNTIERNGYEYNLYRISLGKIKERMNEETRAYLDRGKCQIIFNACLVLVNKNKQSGYMNDNGILSGRVYTSFGEIANAAKWTPAARGALLSYYNKNVRNLFFEVNVNKAVGIDNVSGQGIYCYGTLVEINATPQLGYDFMNWNNNPVNNKASTVFIANSNTTWTAYAKLKAINVVFHRNQNFYDGAIDTQTFYYSQIGQQFSEKNWILPGYHMVGWNEDKNSLSGRYGTYSPVASWWIDKNYPKVDLYAIWQPNNYMFTFEGEFCEKVDNIYGTYGKDVTLPASPNEERVFLGWAIEPGSIEVKYVAGQTISVAEAAQSAKVLYTNNAQIKLYAIWDQIPSIEAFDLYYSYSDIEAGRVTESSVAANFKAYDREDGEIIYGKNEANRFEIISFPQEEINSILTRSSGKSGEKDKIEIVLEAQDSVGNLVTERVYLHFVNTVTASKKETFGKIRFISDKYYKNDDGTYVNEKAGGLMENSCWYKLDDYRSIIEAALSAT